MKKIMRAGAAARTGRERVIQRARDLTDRQRQIVTLVCAGHPNKLIARKLEVSEGTVKTHLHQIFLRLGVARADLRDALGNELAQILSSKAKNKSGT